MAGKEVIQNGVNFCSSHVSVRDNARSKWKHFSSFLIFDQMMPTLHVISLDLAVFND